MTTPTPTEYFDGLTKTLTNMDRFDLFVNGDSDAHVDTDNGPVLSMAATMAAYGDTKGNMDAAAASAAAALASENAAATSASESEISANLAEGYAATLTVATAGRWYSSLAAGVAATTNGQGFYVVDGSGRFLVAENVSGVGTIRAEFHTTAAAGYVTPESFGATGSGEEGAILNTAAVAANAYGAVLRLRRGRTYSAQQFTFPAGTVLETRNAILRVLPGLSGSISSVVIGDDVQADKMYISTPGTEANSTIVSLGARVVIDRLKIVADTQRGGEGIGTTGDNIEIGRLITRKVDRPIHMNNGDSDTPTTGSYIGFLDCESYVRGFRATNCDRWVIGGYRMRDRSPNSHNTTVGTGSLSGSNLTITATERGEWFSYSSTGSKQPVLIYNSAGQYVGKTDDLATGGVYPMTDLTGASIIGGVVYGRRMSDRVGHNGLLISDCCDYEIGEGLIHQAGEHAIRIAGTKRKSTGGTIGRTTIDSCGGCAFKVNSFSTIPTENMTVGPLYGIDVGDFTDSGTGENKEVIRVSHAAEIRIEGAFSDSRSESTNSTYVAKFNDCRSVTINGLGGVANNAGIILDKTADVGGTFATGSISGTTMTITAMISSTATFAVGATIYAGTTYCGEITALGTGTGTTGTYTLSKSSTVSSTTLAANPREAGPVTGLRIYNYASLITSGANAVVFDMDSLNVGEIFIDFAGANGWSGNIAQFTGTPVVTGPIVFAGVISGTATPTFGNAPADANVRADMIWAGRRITGQASLLDGQYQGWQNVAGAAFSSADIKGSQFMANSGSATTGQGNYGAAYEFTRPGKMRRGAAMAVIQTGTAENNTGVEIDVGGTLVASDAVRPAFRVTHDRAIAVIDGVSAPSDMAGWAQIYVDNADGDLKVKFGDGTIKTIVVDT